MTATTFHRVQIVDTYFDLLWHLMRVVLMRMPGTMRRQIDDAQLQARFLQFRPTAETLVVTGNTS